MQSAAATVEEYLESLAPERRAVVSAVRELVLAHLPEGYVEAMNWGMISYEVPLERYPNTYNGEPLSLAGLAAQKNHYSLYLMGIYGSPALRERFESGYRASGKRMDIGKSCVRFRKLEDLPLDLAGEAIAAVGLDELCAMHDASTSLRKSRKH